MKYEIVNIYQKQKFGTEFNYNTTVTEGIITEALKKTNEDFQGLALDWNDVDDKFYDVKASLGINFKLAKIDAYGNPTTGITYHEKKSGFGNGTGFDDEIRKYAWDNKKYMNVYIMRDLYGDGVFNNSGVAWFPSAYMSDNNTARVVYNGSYLSSNTSENFRSVLTHEFGHFLSLHHTFNEGCTYPNDLVEDTPPANKSHMEPEELNCEGNITNWQNFMNYTDQYAMFTRGQVLRMKAALNHEARINLWSESNLRNTGVLRNSNFGPNIQASINSFSEKKINNGTIANSIIISASEGALFAKSSGDMLMGVDFNLSNIPEGLSVGAKYLSNKEIELNLTGEALRHEQYNDVNNLEFSILANAIDGDIESFYNTTIKNISIHYIDKYTKHDTFKTRWGVYSYISDVRFGSIHNESAKSVYTDYSSKYVSNISPGETYILDVVINKGASSETDNNVFRCWIDWNGDMFFDSSEAVFIEEFALSDCSAAGEYSISKEINVPDNVKTGGTIVMRLLNHFKQEDEGLDPYGIVDSGEGEDYGLFVLSQEKSLQLKFVLSAAKLTPAEGLVISNLSSFLDDDPIVEWNWTFPGGTPSSFSGSEPPAIHYSEEGIYDIELNAKTKSGQQLSKVKKEAVECHFKYKVPSIRYGGYAGITNVKIADINSNTQASSMVSDFSKTNKTDIKRGHTYEISLSMNKQNSGPEDDERFQVWIDWNRDCVFSKSELIVSHSFSMSSVDLAGDYTCTSTVLVPVDAKLTETRMRVMLHYVEKQDGEDAAGTIDSGEVEDYSINILNSEETISCDFFASNLKPYVLKGINFFNNSKTIDDDPIVEWNWTFEGAEIEKSSDENPENIIFNSLGLKTVSLSVKTSTGKTASIAKNKFIDVSYLASSPFVVFTSYSFIKSVKINSTIENITDNSKITRGYSSYYKTHVCEIENGENLNIEVISNKGNSGVGDKLNLAMWMDINLDGVFSDSELIGNEVFRIEDNSNGDHVSLFNYTIPKDLPKEKYALRLVLGYNIADITGDILKIESGEIEDYCIDLTAGRGEVLYVPDLILSDEQIEIFPNPVSDFLNIKINSDIRKIEIFNMSGKLLQLHKFPAQTLYVGDLNTGLYILRIYTDKNTYVEKVMIL